MRAKVICAFQGTLARLTSLREASRGEPHIGVAKARPPVPRPGSLTELGGRGADVDGGDGPGRPRPAGRSPRLAAPQPRAVVLGPRGARRPGRRQQPLPEQVPPVAARAPVVVVLVVHHSLAAALLLHALLLHSGRLAAGAGRDQRPPPIAAASGPAGHGGLGPGPSPAPAAPRDTSRRAERGSRAGRHRGRACWGM